MRLSPAGWKALLKEEGCLLLSYKDSGGVWTIGIGCTTYQDGRKVAKGDRLTQAEADVLAQWHIEQVESRLAALITVPLADGQWDAIVSLVFNIGSAAFEHSTLLRKLNASDFAGAAAEFPRWCRVGLSENAGLLARRKREQAMFESALPDLASSVPEATSTIESPFDPGERKPMIPALIPILASAAAELIPAIGKLLSSSASVPERNTQIATEVLKTVVTATNASNEQEALDKIKNDPAALAAATAAVNSVYFELSEVGGGIDSARKAAAEYATKPHNWPLEIVSYALILIFAVIALTVIGAAVWKALITGDHVTMTLQTAFGLVMGVAGFWLGASFTTSKSRGAGATPTQ